MSEYKFSRERRYGGMDSVAENPENCIEELWRGFLSRQCSRKRGHGPDKLYCKQHAKRAKSRGNKEST